MSTPQPFSDVEITASEWLVTLSEPGVAAEERRRFQVWLNTDPEHARVFRIQQQAWSLAGKMQHLLAHQPSIESGRRRPSWQVWSLAAALAVVFVGLLAFQIGGSWFGGQRYATEVAQIKELKLDDGSVISLGAASRIEVNFSSRERRVTLLEGQAFFDVAHDSASLYLG